MTPPGEQTVLVTGSTDGLGKQVAAELVQRGATVLVHGRDPEKVRAAAAETGAAQGLTADLVSLARVRELAGQIGQLDVLVNNAGVIVPSVQRAPTATSSPSRSTTCRTSPSPACSCPGCAGRRAS